MKYLFIYFCTFHYLYIYISTCLAVARRHSAPVMERTGNAGHNPVFRKIVEEITDSMRRINARDGSLDVPLFPAVRRGVHSPVEDHQDCLEPPGPCKTCLASDGVEVDAPLPAPAPARTPLSLETVNALFAPQNEIPREEAAPPTVTELRDVQRILHEHVFDVSGPYADLFTVLLSSLRVLLDAVVKADRISPAPAAALPPASAESSVATTRKESASTPRSQAALGERFKEDYTERIGRVEDHLRRLQEENKIVLAALNKRGSVVEERHRASALRDWEAWRQVVESAFARYASKGATQYSDAAVVSPPASDESRETALEAAHRATVRALEGLIRSVASSDVEPPPPPNTSKGSHAAPDVPQRAGGKAVGTPSLTALQCSSLLDPLLCRIEVLEACTPFSLPRLKANLPFLGFEVLGAGVGGERPLSFAGGIQVTQVYQGYQASLQGLAVGDTLLSVNGVLLGCPRDIRCGDAPSSTPAFSQCSAGAGQLYLVLDDMLREDRAKRIAAIEHDVCVSNAAMTGVPQRLAAYFHTPFTLHFAVASSSKKTKAPEGEVPVLWTLRLEVPNAPKGG